MKVCPDTQGIILSDSSNHPFLSVRGMQALFRSGFFGTGLWFHFSKLYFIVDAYIQRRNLRDCLLYPIFLSQHRFYCWGCEKSDSTGALSETVVNSAACSLLSPSGISAHICHTMAFSLAGQLWLLWPFWWQLKQSPCALAWPMSMGCPWPPKVMLVPVCVTVTGHLSGPDLATDQQAFTRVVNPVISGKIWKISLTTNKCI